jgi:hypothetical protein
MIWEILDKYSISSSKVKLLKQLWWDNTCGNHLLLSEARRIIDFKAPA